MAIYIEKSQFFLCNYNPTLIRVVEAPSRLIYPFLIFALPHYVPDLLLNSLFLIRWKDGNVAFATCSVNDNALRPYECVGPHKFFGWLEKFIVRESFESLPPQEEAELG